MKHPFDRAQLNLGVNLTRQHPFPFLLHVEWGLLGFACLSEILLPIQLVAEFSTLTTLNVVGFALLGLKLPQRKLSHKVAYVALQFGLILLASAIGFRGLRLFPLGLRLFPLLYIILVIRSCLMFRLPGRLVITGIAILAFLTMLSYRVAQVGADRIVFAFAFNATVLFVLILLSTLLFVNALLQERQSREKLSIANHQLRRYAMRVEHLAMEQERNRIAREIHDSLGHSLAGLNLQLEGALKLLRSHPEQAEVFLKEAKQLGSDTLKDVRQSVSAMRSDPLAGKQLEGAIAKLIDDFEHRTGIQPVCKFDLDQPLANELKLTLYRLIQEGLTNIIKHANATQVAITIQSHHQAIHLVIQDNGKGFDPAQNETGFGLQGMRERSIALTGTLRIISAPGQGCQILATFPFSINTPHTLD